MGSELVWNERVKLRANALNGLCISSIALGGLAPLAAALYGTGGRPALVISGILLWCAAGLAFHLIGYHVLRYLR